MFSAQRPGPVGTASGRQDPVGAGIGLLATAAAVAILGACFSESDTGPTTELNEVTADEIVYGVSRRVTRDGVQELFLEADSMFIWRDSAFASVFGLTLVAFDEQGRRRANVNADGGRIRTVGGELSARGNAVLRVTQTGQVIRTDVLNFAVDEDRVWSDLEVVMEEDGCTLAGDSFQSDLSFDEVKIWGTREGECRQG